MTRLNNQSLKIYYNNFNFAIGTERYYCDRRICVKVIKLMITTQILENFKILDCLEISLSL